MPQLMALERRQILSVATRRRLNDLASISSIAIAMGPSTRARRNPSRSMRAFCDPRWSTVFRQHGEFWLATYPAPARMLAGNIACIPARMPHGTNNRESVVRTRLKPTSGHCNRNTPTSSVDADPSFAAPISEPRGTHIRALRVGCTGGWSVRPIKSYRWQLPDERSRST
jgi:hypothetical protein